MRYMDRNDDAIQQIVGEMNLAAVEELISLVERSRVDDFKEIIPGFSMFTVLSVLLKLQALMEADCFTQYEEGWEN